MKTKSILHVAMRLRTCIFSIIAVSLLMISDALGQLPMQAKVTQNGIASFGALVQAPRRGEFLGQENIGSLENFEFAAWSKQLKPGYWFGVAPPQSYVKLPKSPRKLPLSIEVKKDKLFIRGFDVRGDPFFEKVGGLKSGEDYDVVKITRFMVNPINKTMGVRVFINDSIIFSAHISLGLIGEMAPIIGGKGTFHHAASFGSETAGLDLLGVTGGSILDPSTLGVSIPGVLAIGDATYDTTNVLSVAGGAAIDGDLTLTGQLLTGSGVPIKQHWHEIDTFEQAIPPYPTFIRHTAGQISIGRSYPLADFTLRGEAYFEGGNLKLGEGVRIVKSISQASQNHSMVFVSDDNQGNSFFGRNAGDSITGNGNTMIGFEASMGVNGDRNTALGAYVTFSKQNLSHSTGIGYGAVVERTAEIVAGTPIDTLRVPNLAARPGSSDSALVAVKSDGSLYRLSFGALNAGARLAGSDQSYEDTGCNCLPEIDEMLAYIQALEKRVQMIEDGASGVQFDDRIDQPVLYQNTPNPFGEEGTKIPFFVPGDKEAEIIVMSLDGNVVQKYTVSGRGTVSYKYDAGQGLLVYVLLLGGEIVGTKQMVRY